MRTSTLNKMNILLLLSLFCSVVQGQVFEALSSWWSGPTTTSSPSFNKTLYEPSLESYASYEDKYNSDNGWYPATQQQQQQQQQQQTVPRNLQESSYSKSLNTG